MRSAPEAGQGGSLSAFDIGCVVVGGIVGVGIFFTPAVVARRAASGAEVLLAWGCGGLLAVLGALVFAELGARVPGHGGIFRYVHAAFGRLPAFLYGWSNWLVIQAGALGVVALVCIEHVERAIRGAPVLTPAERVGFATAAIVAFTLTNLLGLRVGKLVQNALTTVKVLALLGLCGVAVAAAPTDAAAAAAERAGSWPSRLAAAMLPVLFAIGGWQQGSFLAGAARRPRRDVPIGVLGGVLVVVAVYMAINLAYLHLLGFDGAARSPAIGADAARAAMGGGGERVLAAMVAVSAAGIMNTICLAPPYVLLAMAEAGLLPRAFALRHPRLRTPWFAVLGQGLWAALLLLLVHGFASMLAGEGGDAATVDTLGFACDGVVFVDWLFFAVCGLSLLRLRRQGPGSFALPAGGFVALAFCGGALLVTIGALWANAAPSLAGGLFVLLGLAGYRLLARPGPR